MPPYLPTSAYQEGCKWSWLFWMPNVLSKQYKMFNSVVVLLCYYSVSSLIAIKILFFFWWHIEFLLGFHCWWESNFFLFILWEEFLRNSHFFDHRNSTYYHGHPKFILLRNDNMYLYNDHLFFMDRINCLLSSGIFNDNCCSSIVFFSHLSVKGTLKKKIHENIDRPLFNIPLFCPLYIFVNFKLGQVGTGIH